MTPSGETEVSPLGAHHESDMSLNLATLLEARASSDPDSIALAYDGRQMGYAELNARASCIANGLSRIGVAAGSKVAVMLPNVPEFVLSYYAILKLGGCVVPINTLLKASEIAHQVEDSDAAALIVGQAFLPEVREALSRVEAGQRLFVVGQHAPGGWHLFDELVANTTVRFDTVQTSPQDTAVILYTAGVAGRPKGAELSHFNMFYNGALTADRLCHLTPEDRVLAVLPLFHAFGQSCVMNASLYAGARLVLLPRFEPDRVLQAVERQQVTVLLGVPTMYWYLQHYPEAERYDRASLRLCCSGGAPLPVRLMEQFAQRYGLPIFEGYGLAETSPVVSFNPTDRPNRPGSIGLPIYGVTMDIRDEDDHPVPQGHIGEIVVRGHNVMKGYYKRPGPTAEVMRNGWFHTGDLGRVDSDGYYYIVGRKKDILIRGGLNIYAREVEMALLAHPSVVEAAVVGVPDEVMGEEVKAFVVLEPDAVLEADELIEYVRARVAAYKYPRYVEFRSELPKDAAGKVIKRLLRA